MLFKKEKKKKHPTKTEVCDFASKQAHWCCFSNSHLFASGVSVTFEQSSQYSDFSITVTVFVTVVSDLLTLTTATALGCHALRHKAASLLNVRHACSDRSTDGLSPLLSLVPQANQQPYNALQALRWKQDRPISQPQYSHKPKSRWKTWGSWRRKSLDVSRGWFMKLKERRHFHNIKVQDEAVVHDHCRSSKLSRRCSWDHEWRWPH